MSCQHAMFGDARFETPPSSWLLPVSVDTVIGRFRSLPRLQCCNVTVGFPPRTANANLLVLREWITERGGPERAGY